MQQTARPARVLSTATENVSSRGFCCVVDEPVTEGERLVCQIGLPSWHDPHVPRALRCQAQVAWVVPTEDGRFRIGCRIEDYRVVA